jgi:short-subunit dehydrogenase
MIQEQRYRSASNLSLDRYGPWAVVTGASSGIGLEFAQQLAGGGFNLLLTARRVDMLDEVASDLGRRHGIETRVVGADLSTPMGPDLVIAAAEGLDVGLLISNAGSGRPGEFLSHHLVDLESMVRLNATSHLALAHHFGNRLKERGRGGIIIVSAGGALHGLPYMVNDSAAKAYALNLGEGLHYELAPAGVDVTVAIPFAVETPIIDLFGIDRTKLPLRPQPVEDCVADALVALRKGRATRITGTTMRILSSITPRKMSIRMNGRMLAKASPSERTVAI